MNLRKKENVSIKMTFEADDKLNRKNIAENFNILFRDTSQPFVISLDSPWGTGKTQFIHMWRNLLNEKEYESIYFNSWQEDFIKNPLFSLSEAFVKRFEEQEIGTSQNRKELKKIGWTLARAAVNKVCNIDIDQFIESNPIQDQINNKEIFKKNLGSLANKIKEKTGFPLLVFVDELDRCRPDYAVEFLEVIKHFFEVENIIFILSIDAEQLQHSIKSLYGLGMDAKEYLRKFIDISYSFKSPQLEVYLDFLFSKFNCGKKDKNLITISKEIIKKFSPSLRGADHLFIRLNLIEMNINDSYPIATFLLASKLFQHEQYASLIKNKLSIEHILKLSNYFDIPIFPYTRIIFWKLANDLILNNSQNESEYFQNIKFLFQEILKEWPNIGSHLRSYASGEAGFHDNHISVNPILKIFLEDIEIKQQSNQATISSIFSSKDGYLREFNNLINKIDFLEGLDFFKDKDGKTNTTAK